jgi:hypothetical protein
MHAQDSSLLERVSEKESEALLKSPLASGFDLPRDRYMDGHEPTPQPHKAPAARAGQRAPWLPHCGKAK